MILVPWRPTPDGVRTAVWDAVRPHLDRLGWPINMAAPPFDMGPPLLETEDGVLGSRGRVADQTVRGVAVVTPGAA